MNNNPIAQLERFVRTVLGDVPAQQLGLCYAHEHLIIDSSYPTQTDPDFLLDSMECGATELQEFFANGGRAMVDSMPCDAGRNVLKIAEISRRTGVHIVCPTGAHLSKYYPDGHWSGRYSVEQLAGLFVADIQNGIDTNDYSGPIVERTSHQAGIIKLATQGIGLTERERRLFQAGAIAHCQTGCPILTHVEEGRGGIEQVEFLRDANVDLHHVVLSHTDRNPDPDYHRELLTSGVSLEYDSAFRWKEGNPTLDLLVKLYPEFGGQLLLGMDAARRCYWHAYGGGPGLSYLLTVFREFMDERGLGPDAFNRIFKENPARVYAFARVKDRPEARNVRGEVSRGER
jgi:5-phospho-D-xylono-1,4-lactonase